LNQIPLSGREHLLLKNYIGEMRGLKKIGSQILHEDPRSFKYVITGLGFEIPASGSIWKKMKDHYKGKFTAAIDTPLNEILLGMMLGDMNIRLQSKSKPHPQQPTISEYQRLLREIEEFRQRVRSERFIDRADIDLWNKGIKMIQSTNTASVRIHKSSTEFDFVKVLYKLLGKHVVLGSPFFRRNNNARGVRWNCGFDTSSLIEFYEMWRNWYKFRNGKYIKHIPRNSITKATPDLIFHYYIDDGWYSGNRIQISNSSFSHSDIHYLIRLIRAEGIRAKPYLKANSYSINISHSKKNRIAFFEFISQATLYKKVSPYFPHKLIRGYSKKEYVKEHKSRYPEFYEQNSQLRTGDYWQ